MGAGDVNDTYGNNPIINPIIQYPKLIEEAIEEIRPFIEKQLGKWQSGLERFSRWLALKLLEQDESLMQEISIHIGKTFLESEELQTATQMAREKLLELGIDNNKFKDMVVSSIVKKAEKICHQAVTYENSKYAENDRRLDKIFTGKFSGYLVMMLLLAVVFWLTIVGANLPSKLLAERLFWVQDRLTDFFMMIHAPDWLHGVLVLGAYRVLAWVVSVMLPPMAIFFPLFTLLEDSGYLPRIAYNLDKPFKKCQACGKQALCMCMGFGCNAAGVIGCRIIDSPRERLLAILTMFFVGTAGSALNSVWSALLLTGVIIFGVVVTLVVSRFLSKTLLKGEPSFFCIGIATLSKTADRKSHCSFYF